MTAIVTSRNQLPSLSFAAGPGCVPIDLDRLVGTRLLIQASSGGGKSYCLRWLLEQTHGRIQQFVLDWEGEFASLRERFAYVLAGQDGDVPADPRTAGLLCRRLLELSASAVLDLSELPPEDRQCFARGFLHELMHVPRSLWRPLLVAIDEAHHLAPEKGEGEAVSKPAVVALCTQGRKRGYAAVLATQRIAKVTNNALAELLNVLIGRPASSLTCGAPGMRWALTRHNASSSSNWSRASSSHGVRRWRVSPCWCAPDRCRPRIHSQAGSPRRCRPRPRRSAPCWASSAICRPRPRQTWTTWSRPAAASPSSSARSAICPLRCARRSSSNVSRCRPSTRGQCIAWSCWWPP